MTDETTTDERCGGTPGRPRTLYASVYPVARLCPGCADCLTVPERWQAGDPAPPDATYLFRPPEQPAPLSAATAAQPQEDAT